MLLKHVFLEGPDTPEVLPTHVARIPPHDPPVRRVTVVVEQSPADESHPALIADILRLLDVLQIHVIHQLRPVDERGGALLAGKPLGPGRHHFVHSQHVHVHVHDAVHDVADLTGRPYVLAREVVLDPA